MKMIERVASFFGLNASSSTLDAQNLEALQITLERARRFKRSGKYDDAIKALDEALSIATFIPNEALPVAINLHRVDILTRQKAWSESALLLQHLEADAKDRDNHDFPRTKEQQSQLAYVKLGYGVLAQAQGEWEEARQNFELALKIAQEISGIGAEGRAQGHLADVYLHEGNASYATYLLQEAMPKLNASGDVEMSSYFLGRLGQAMIQTGKKSEGQQIIGRALRVAEQMEYRQYELMWRQELSLQAMEEGLYEEARRHLMIVLSHIKMGHNLTDRVLSLCRLSKVALHLGDLDAAIGYAQDAYKHANDGNDIADKQRATVTLGIVLRTIGNNDEALSLLEEYAEQYRQLPLTFAEFSFVDLLRNLGAALTESGRSVEARETYSQAVAYSEENDLRRDLAGTYRDIGISYTRQQDYQQAIQSWNSAIHTYEGLDQPANVARIHCDIANARRRSGHAKRAMKDYEQALMLLSSVQDDETRGIVLSNAATAYVDFGDIETAESFFVEAIQIAQKLQDRESEATRRGNYGWFLMTTGRSKLALSTLDYALRQSESLGMGLQSAVQMDNIGLAYDELKDFEQAVTFHGKAWERLKTVEGDDYWRGIVSANLAHSLISLGKLADVETLLAASREIGDNKGRPDLSARSRQGYIRLAFVQQASPEEIKSLVDEAVMFAQQYGGRRLIADSLLFRSQFAASVGDNTVAQEQWEQARTILRVLRVPLADDTPAWLSTSLS